MYLQLRNLASSAKRQTWLPVLLLALILLYGAALRLRGHNWDDFSYTHPDERFLTALLLPQIGGGNSFTDDRERYPPQSILAPADSPFRDRWGFLEEQEALLGIVADGITKRAADGMLEQQRIRHHEHLGSLEDALYAGIVDAVMVTADDRHFFDERFKEIAQLSSAELQDQHCRELYPESGGIGGYFDSRCSPYNPHNAGHGFYVYGTFPLFMAHFANEIVQDASARGLPFFDHQSGHLVWRGISSVFDLFTIILVFLLTRRLGGVWAGLLAALLYASAPLAIQKAYFGTTNAVTGCLVTAALYLAVDIQQSGKLRSYLLFGALTGAAVASRFNVAPLAGIVVLAGLLHGAPMFARHMPSAKRRALCLQMLLGWALSGLAAFLLFRCLNPYTFTGPGFFGLELNPRWLANIAQINSGVSDLADFPPNWQWVARAAVIYPLKDMLLWGMGLGFGLLAWLGWARAGYRLLCMRKSATESLLLLVWVGGYGLFMSRIESMTMRYYLPLYGSLAVLAALCMQQWLVQTRRRGRAPRSLSLSMLLSGSLLAAVGVYQVSVGVWDATSLTALFLGGGLLLSALLPRWSRWRAWIYCGFVLLFSLLWGLMFGNISRQQLTLVQSAHYMAERLPGDFSMRIDGSDITVPLVNINFNNTGYPMPGSSNRLFERVNHYQPGQEYTREFSAAGGTISRISAPYLGDPLDDPEPEDIRITIEELATGNVIASAQLRANFSRDSHPLGAPYSVDFEQPFTVAAGERYRFTLRVTAESGDIIGSGPVVYTEGDWDNRVPGINICQLPDGLTLADRPPSGLLPADECRGRYLFYDQVNEQDQIMSFPLDNANKLQNTLDSLEYGDYLTIASNRFYDTISRIPQRWPLTKLYYDSLFAGELGFELEAAFTESFAFGPWRLSDQHLPGYASPAWLNELEPDEAFHVYDHPAVFIFRKTPQYSPARAAAILGQISLKQIHEVQENSDEAQLLGVVNWSLAEADAVPTALTFPAAERAIQSAGGTWSQRFFSDSLASSSQVFGLLSWYVTILVFGLLAFPLVHSLMPQMADGGYGISKLAGMLLVAWFAWAVSSLKVPIWSQAGVLLSLCLLGCISLARSRIRFVEFVRDHWRRLAWMELLALLAFLLMVAVRLSNPDLWHPGKGGEKPMDFAYLNGVLRSTTFPPIDPWFAGGFINYYYFGYVLLGAPTLLLGLVPAFAYNLMIPTIFSLTGMGAFSAAFNILSHWQKHAEPGERRRRLGNPWHAGILALLLCVLLGNLDTPRVLGHGLARLGGYDRPEGLRAFLLQEHTAQQGSPSAEELAALSARAAAYHPLDSLRYELSHSADLLASLLRGAQLALQGESLPIGSDRWYWGPSRVLAETPGVAGNAITEMPFFTFLYGDLHAHMISMPFILLTVLLLFNEIACARRDMRRPGDRALAILLLALTVGLLQATNTWDWPTMTLLSLLGLGYAWWLRWQASFRPMEDARFRLALAGLLLLGAALLSLLLGNDATAMALPSLFGALGLARAGLLAACGGLILWLALSLFLQRKSALDLLASVGGFLAMSWAFALPYTSWYASTYNSLQLWQGGKTPLWAYFDIHGLFLFLLLSLLLWESAHWLRHTRVQSLLDNRQVLQGVALACGLLAVSAIVLAMIGYQVAFIVLPLLGWMALHFFRAGQSRHMRFVLALAGLALCITLGVEVIVLGGDIGRQNTVFKFYMQVWLLLSLVGGIAGARLIQHSRAFRRPLRWLWWGVFLLLFGIAALFPIMGTRARSFDRMVPELPLTLNGLDYMTQATHYEYSPESDASAWLDLSVDYQLIRWLQENVQGTPVIMEGRRPGSEYQWNGRMSINTGLPSVLGWNWHQRQQRTFTPLPSWVFQREQNIRRFYDSADIDVAVDILAHFDVRYIISSGLEAVHASPEGIAKFERMVELNLLEIAYALPGGTIYRVRDGALMQWLEERHR